MLIESSSVLKTLTAMIDTRNAQLSQGAIKNFEDYKTVTGQISGLNSAISTINDLLEKQRKSDGEN